MIKKILSYIMILVLIAGITPCYAEALTETHEAESFSDSLSASQKVQSKITYMEVLETGFLSYKINVLNDGFYSFNMRASGTTTTSVNLSLDGVGVLQMNLRNTGNVRTFDDNFAVCKLSKGEHTLKISATSGKLNLDYFVLVGLDSATDEKAEAFLKELNDAKKADEVYSVLSAYKDIFNINLADIEKGIFYKEPIFAEMAGQTFDDINEFFEKIYAFARQYKKTPDVSFYNGNVNLSELKNGNLTMLVRPQRFTKPVLVIGAIYKDSRLYKINYKEYTNQTSLSIPFDGVEVDASADYKFKAVYVDGLNTLSSYDAYPDVMKTIYVSPSGNDENAGTKDAPLKTLSGAKEMIASLSGSMKGDILVSVKSGEYFLDETEVFTSAHGGKNGYNVIIKGEDENNPPVFHGGKKVSGWTEYKNGIYSAPLDGVETVRNLYVNGFSAVRARSESVFRCVSFYDDAETEYERDGYCVLSKRMPYTFERPQDLEMVWELYWTCQRVPVSDAFVDGDMAIFKSDAKDCINESSGTEKININKDKHFYLENAMELLDSPGEFYFNPNEKKIYYYPYEGESLEDTYVAVTEGLFEIGSNSETQKTENIIFDNLSIKYGAWNEVSSIGLVGIQADSIYDWSESDSTTKMMHSQFLVNNANGIDITNCEFSCLGSNAVHFKDDVSNSKIEGNIIKDTSGGGISIGSFNHTPTVGKMCVNIDVKNNLIRRISQEYRQCAAISVYYENSINLCHNDIADIPYTGITVGWGWGFDSYNAGNITLCHNKITDVMNCLKDGSNIYTLGPLKDSAIYENYTDDSKYKISGIYNDSGSAYMKIFKNVFYDDDPEAYWWYQGLNHTKELHAYKNYVASGVVNESGENNIEENTILITKDNLPKEAQDIMNNSGLSDEFKNLYSKADLPSYKESVVKHSPSTPYGKVHARYAAKYDRSYDPVTGNVLTPSDEYVSFGRQEWIEYDVWAEKSGTYSLSMYASNGWAEKKPQYLSISVDGRKQIDYTVTPSDGWTPYVEYVIGNIELKEGKNTIRFKNESVDYYGFHFSYLIIE